MVQARQQVLDACSRHGVAAGIHVVPPEPGEVGRCIEQGYKLIAYSLDITMLTRACRDGVTALQQFGWTSSREASS
jgi:2-dehydro-3-deoxyglucarate aldolase